MKEATITLVHGRLNRTKNGSKLVEIKVYFPQLQKKVFRSTGIWIPGMSWKDGKVSSRDNDYNNRFNRMLKNQVKEIEAIQDSCIIKKIPFTPNSLKQDSPVSFNDFYKKSVTKGNVRLPTVTDRKGTLRILNEFKTISFHELTPKFVDDFNEYIINKGYHVNTIWKHHKNIKLMCNMAIRQDIITSSPYKAFSVKRITKNKFALTDDQVMAIYYMPTSLIGDMFLLSCATGLRFSDITTLTNDQIVFKNGMYYIYLDEMKKIEGRGVRVCVHEFYKFNDVMDRNLGSLFHKVTNLQANKALKQIQKDLGFPFKTPITFHVSRHTYLTKVAKETGSIFTVMANGGISSVQTAQGYVDMAKII